MRRYSPSQIQNLMRQAEQKQRQAINNYNNAVRRHNQQVKSEINRVNSEINRYNQAVRTHNARVRANRQRIQSELSRLTRQASVTQYVTYRVSVRTLHESYVRLENRAETHQFDPLYNRVLDLSERETANSLAVTNRLLGEEENTVEEDDNLQDAELLDNLRKISPDLDHRWQGAVFALNPRNPDAARHFCTSVREIITQILEIEAPDTDVIRLVPNCDKTRENKPTRREKIRFILHRNGMKEATLEEFVENDMENIVQLFRVLNDGAHGTAGKFDFVQLGAIKKRVEDAITFLTTIIAVNSTV